MGQKSHSYLHSFMDDFSKQLGWGHRLLRHNADMIRMAGDLYGEGGEREASFHIACDMGMVTPSDLKWGQIAGGYRLREATKAVAKGK